MPQFHRGDQKIYSESFIECNPLDILWLMQMQHKCAYINQTFDTNYVLLGYEELTNFVEWLLKRREEFENTAITRMGYRHFDADNSIRDNSIH